MHSVIDHMLEMICGISAVSRTWLFLLSGSLLCSIQANVLKPNYIKNTCCLIVIRLGLSIINLGFISVF